MIPLPQTWPRDAEMNELSARESERETHKHTLDQLHMKEYTAFKIQPVGLNHLSQMKYCVYLIS